MLLRLFVNTTYKILMINDCLTCLCVTWVFVIHEQVLEDVTGEEFKIFMKILTSMPSMGTVQGRQNLLDIIISEADFKSKFEVGSRGLLL